MSVICSMPTAGARRERNGEKIFWSRGNGWVLAGLARMISELAIEDPYRDFYIDVFRAIAERVASLQPPDGLWRPSLLDPDAYPSGESSGTAFFTYGLAWGVNQGILPESRFLPVIERAWRALCGNVDADGRLGWVQAIGAEPDSAGENGLGAIWVPVHSWLAGSELAPVDPG